jgi:penicillin amidase
MRPLFVLALLAPQASDGWTTLRAGDEEVRVFRDAWGIPHVFAKTVRAAFWAEGWTEAEDRFGQMENFRRGARGEAAELQGPAALANDRDRARRGYTAGELRKLFEAASPRTRGILEAYADGVNAWLAKAGSAARPWDVTDSIAIGVLMARRFGEAGDLELTVSRVYDELVRKAGEEDARKILRDLLRPDDASAPTTLDDHVRSKVPVPKEKGFRSAPGMSGEAYAVYRAELDAILASREALGLPVYFGSNAWVVAPSRSATGNAMLYGGPMMGFGTPAICNEIHLSAEGLNVGGMSFPGVPGVMIGWNDRVAWTTTSGGADLVDVYALELNPEDPDEYRWQGGWRKFEVLEREIKVRGAESEKLRVYRSVHGPLAGERDLKKHRAYALRMSFWMREGETIDGVFDMNFAGTLEEFAKGAAKVTSSHNFFCATADGRIGYWFCGAHPKRKAGHDPAFPQPGDGSMEWEGFVPVADWPQSVDPPRGWFGNWNNKPARAWPSPGFGKIFWGKKILDVLEAEPKITPARFAEIARLTAYHSYLADYFVPLILDAAKGSEDPDVKKAVEVLSAWDRMEVEGHPGPVLVERWSLAAARRIFAGLVDPLLLASPDVRRYVSDPLLYTLEGERRLVPLHYDYGKGKDLKAIVLDSLKEVLKPGLEALAWKEPTIDFKGQVGPLKSKRGRGTYQVAVEMTKDGPRAATLSAPGQSERPESKHHKDQAALFEKWGYKPFVWRREEME